MTDGPSPAGPRPGPTNSLVDVAGLRVGHAQRVGDGWRTGVTVVLAGPHGAVAGVDVRGGGPGTRETDALDPRNLVERAHAVVLAGGSAYGLAAADGVLRRLADAGVGFAVGVDPAHVVPIVPAAVIYDLGRGGDFRATPDAAMGADAYDAALQGDGTPAQGSVGAGTGAVAGGLAGGVGSASAVLDDGVTVAALVVVNAIGSTVDAATGGLYGVRCGLPDEFPAPPVGASAQGRGAGTGSDGFHTTLAVVATDASLAKARCAKLAGIGHDGMARAIRPVHTMFDGDTVFALATGTGTEAGPVVFHGVLTAAADCVSRAVAHAMRHATGRPDSPSYTDTVRGAAH